MNRPKIAVVGAGMAGLSAAWSLKAQGFDPIVFEADAAVGGRTRSIEKDGFILDLGAIFLTPGYRRTLGMLREAGGADLILESKPTLALWRDGLHEMDLSRPIASLMGMKLLSGRSVLRFARLLPTMFRHRKHGTFEGLCGFADLDHETAQAFTNRELSAETYDYAFDPLLRPNTLGPTADVSAALLIWLLMIAATDRFVGIAGGTGAIAKQVAAPLDVRTKTAVRRVRQQGETVAIELDDGLSETFDAAVIATPPPVALEIASDIPARLRTMFSHARPVLSTTVHLGLRGFPPTRAAMVLVPTRDQPDLTGIILDSNKCPDRAPPGHSLISLHLGGDWTKRHREADDHTVAETAIALAKPFIGDVGDAVMMTNVARWAYVDYVRPVGSVRALCDIGAAPSSDRIAFAGDYLSAGVEGAAVNGERVAQSLVRHVLHA